MWTVPRREGPDERCDRLLALYEQQIQELEACKPSPYWDGYCGLVRVCDEDLVRPDSAQNTAAQAAQQQKQTEQEEQQRRSQRLRQQVGSGSGAADAGAAAGQRPGGRAAGTRTPPAASPRNSPGTSPFKPGPRGKHSAALLVEQATLLLQQQGRLREAESVLHAALRACPTTDTQLAGRCIDLLLEAEREAQETPSHSRAASDVDPVEDHVALAWTGTAGTVGGAAGGAAGGGSGGAAVGEVAPLLRAGIEALAAGEEWRAVASLQKAADACPPELVELRRRVELYLELLQCKKRV